MEATKIGLNINVHDSRGRGNTRRSVRKRTHEQNTLLKYKL